jgi:membrane protease YdiL (CAAX protease family)
MADTFLTLFKVGSYLLAVVSLVGWIWLIRQKVSTRSPIIQPRARTEPFWTLAEFFLCFGLWLVCTTAASLTARRLAGLPLPGASDIGKDAADSLPTTPDELVAIMVAASVANGIVLLYMLVQMGLTNRKVASEYGLWPDRGDLSLGAIAAVFILPPTLLISQVLEQFVPYEHQVFDVIKENPSLLIFFTMSISAVIVAPLFEETLFRMLLQGGGQRIARRSEMQGSPELKNGASPHEALITAEEVSTWSWWPIVIASLTFSTMHIGQGAAPIPLFFFSVCIGYLYRQTGRLWPCIIVHFLLNAFSMTGFGLEVLSAGVTTP